MAFDVKQLFGDLFSAACNSYSYKDNFRTELAIRKPEYEKNLDEMWINYMKGNARQLEEYFKGVNRIKSVGCKVLRNTAGKHKIVFPKVEG